MNSHFIRPILRSIGLVLTIASASGLCGEEYVTKEEFEKFKNAFEKFRAENEKLKEQNAQLVKQMENVKASIQHAPVESKLETYLKPQDVATKEDFDSVRSGTTKFLISGWADSGFEDRSGSNSTFTSSFHPVFLWKISDQISFESDFGFATIDYHFHDLLTLEAGRFLTPLGTFARTQRPSWINKLPDRPFVFSESNGLVPEISVGAMLEGGFDAGPTKFNWAAFVANGPTLNAGSPSQFGSLDFSSAFDNNQNKAVGGRIGFLPIPELEIGGSFESARVGQNRTAQAGTDALLVVADLSFNKVISQLKGTVDVRASWVWSKVGDAIYTVNGDDVLFNNNQRNGGYAQVAYRPTLIEHKWARNLEAVLRYDRLDNPNATADTPDEARPQRVDRDRWTVGLNYWFASSTVLKFAYEKDSRDDHALLFQFALGF